MDSREVSPRSREVSPGLVGSHAGPSRSDHRDPAGSSYAVSAVVEPATQHAAPYIPARFGPEDGEAAVLSVLAVKHKEEWLVAAGSLLTVPAEAATSSWIRWGLRQPSLRDPRVAEGFDLGPVFAAEPFPGIRVSRQVVWPGRWQAYIDGLSNGVVEAGQVRLRLPLDAWSSPALLAQSGLTDAHHVIRAACRPVQGVVASLSMPEMPESEATWEWQLPPHLPRGPVRGRLYKERHLLHWPKHLLGIYWLGNQNHQPPARFVVGRTEDRKSVV